MKHQPFVLQFPHKIGFTSLLQTLYYQAPVVSLFGGRLCLSRPPHTLIAEAGTYSKPLGSASNHQLLKPDLQTLYMGAFSHFKSRRLVF